MAGVFACPECGRELALEGLSPGREILCDECSTWVEVPFLPRASGWKQRRHAPYQSPWWKSKLLRVAILFVVVAGMGLVASRVIGGRVRSGKERVLAELLASADKAEAAKRYDTALIELEAALSQTRTMDLGAYEKLEALRERRDRVSRLEAEARLARIDSLAPAQAVGESKIIDDRARHDPALAPLAATIKARLESSRRRQVEADLEIATQAYEAGKDAQAFEVAERLHDRAGALPRSDAERFQKEARSLLEAAVARSGVALPLVGGRFVAGSAEAYTAILERHQVETARARGFLPQPRRSPWAMLWDEKAPFRMTVQIAETQDQFYLESKNRTTQVDGTFELLHEGRVVWKTRVVTRTRTFLPDLTAYHGGRVATGDKRNPETERRLHDDAVRQFVEQTVKNLRGFPLRETALRAF
jgi:hypothetical protein